jgi:methylenetetrahydrofolate--tRNA-(uracil-5-)-methyltransferase
MNEDEYNAFYEALRSAECAELHDFDHQVFEGCMPIEEMARRGKDTMRYGPLKPVGLVDDRTGKKSYGVVQLRKDNAAGTLYNIVGFQTHLAFPEQKRVFGLIPGLSHAEFFRYGVMHRNTYLNSPGFLSDTYSVKAYPKLFFAGQITGVEGYIESTSSGFVAGVNAARLALLKEPVVFPKETEIGALAAYVSLGGVSSVFQPMNANFGIIAPFEKKIKGGKKMRNEAYASRSLDIIENDFSFLKN